MQDKKFMSSNQYEWPLFHKYHLNLAAVALGLHNVPGAPVFIALFPWDCGMDK